MTGEESLAFFDAIAPIVHHESIDMSIAWKQSRYDKAGPGGGGADYINCPLDKEQYEAFVAGLLAGDKTEFKQWEANTPYFQGCQPIEVIASTGPQSLRFGPMKPVGLRDPRTDRRPWAVVQLRQDNALGTLWNIVGFQTKLKHGEQVRIFRTIPGLQNAEFARLGGLHRNTFLNSPRLLDGTLRLKALPRLRFAGQITGCEGYVESAAVGLLAGRFAAAELRGETPSAPPPTTAMGALLDHITGGADATTFQPMNVNFGLFPPIEGNFRGKERKQAMAARALQRFRPLAGAERLVASVIFRNVSTRSVTKRVLTSAPGWVENVGMNSPSIIIPRKLESVSLQMESSAKSAASSRPTRSTACRSGRHRDLRRHHGRFAHGHGHDRRSGRPLRCRDPDEAGRRNPHGGPARRHDLEAGHEISSRGLGRRVIQTRP